MANSVDPDQIAPIRAVCSRSTLFASILNLSVMLGNNLQLTTSADDIFRCSFLLGVLRVKKTILGQLGDLFSDKGGRLQLYIDRAFCLSQCFTSKSTIIQSCQKTFCIEPVLT